MSAPGTSGVSASNEAVLVGAQTINAFLDRQSPATLSKLYSMPASCLAIFRLLPMLAGHLIMIMLWQEGTLSVSDYTPFIRQEGLGHSKVAMERLERLWIITQKNGKLSMSSTFREGLRRALTGGGDHRSFGVPSNTTSNQITISTLDDYAKSRWESILHYMVGSSGSSIPSKTVLNLLLKSQLMQKVPSSRNEYNITSKGFQFLLEDVNTQLWSLLLQYLSDSEELGGGGGDLVEVLNFLFLLGSLELGREYSTEDLTRTQVRMLKDFKEFGLIYQDESDENGEEKNGFYPTRLAVTLTSNENPIKEDREINEDDGFLILETNYRLYAYTGSNLRIAVLNLFCSLKKRFQNLVTGNITRESVKRALANGITAEQIIAYLTHHAHPQMSKNDPLLPVTCTDQIRLWEREKHRVTTEAGALFTDFESSGDFQMVRNYAQESGYLIWENEEQRRFFVTEDGRPQIGEFIRRRMN